MAKCKWCGESFDREDALYEFEGETLLNYANLALRLCGSCAIQAIEDEVDGVYFETCADCGTQFDLIEEQSKFDSDPNDFGYLRDYWDDGDRPRCAECALKKAEEEYEKQRAEYPEDYDSYGYDVDDGERISVDDAAQIWASHGKDEDYMFGYTEDELEDAL